LTASAVVLASTNREINTIGTMSAPPRSAPLERSIGAFRLAMSPRAAPVAIV
jgi:hypothetical protein